MRTYFSLPERFIGGEKLATFTGRNSHADALLWASNVTHPRLWPHREAFTLKTYRDDAGVGTTVVYFNFDEVLA